MPDDFTGTVASNRHYSTGTTEGQYSLTVLTLVVPVCAKRFHRHCSGKPTLLNRHYSGATTTVLVCSNAKAVLTFPPPPFLKVNSRASAQLRILKSKLHRPEKVFRSFDVDRKGTVGEKLKIEKRQNQRKSGDDHDDFLFVLLFLEK